MVFLYLLGLILVSHVLKLLAVPLLQPDRTALEIGPLHSSYSDVGEPKPFGHPSQLSYLEMFPPPAPPLSVTILLEFLAVDLSMAQIVACHSPSGLGELDD